MKKSTKFTLVRKFNTSVPTLARSRTSAGARAGPGSPSKSKARGLGGITKNSPEAVQAVIDSVKASPDLVKMIGKLDQKFRVALGDSFVTTAWNAGKSRKKTLLRVDPAVVSVARDLSRQQVVRRVGVLDMSAWIGGMPKLLERLNAAQPLFTIFEVQAPMPGGLLKTPLGMAEWASENLGKPQPGAFKPHVIANKFFAAAEDIRESMGLDLIVGITPALVAGVDEDGSLYWNHFSSVLDKAILLSTTDLRRFAGEAGRPFEVGIGVLLVVALLIAVNPKLEYHEDTGCVFDYNRSRDSLSATLKSLAIDEQCLNIMTAAQRDTATKMLAVLKRMKRRAS